MGKRSFVLGACGQDGSYLVEHLTQSGHDVHAAARRPRPGMATVDLLDGCSIERALTRVQPDVVYNLAAVTAPGGSWGVPQPPLLADVTAVGVVRLLDAMCKVTPAARLVHASSSAIYQPDRYGLYGLAKLFAHRAVVGYRRAGLLAATNAVLYSHTSPRQDARFLARRVTAAAARIGSGRVERIRLTNLDSARDWGDARDYVRALALLAEAAPGDYDVATGRTHTVRDLVDAALAAAGITWNMAVDVEPGDRAPDETPADITALTALGWSPRYTFEDTITTMVLAEMRPAGALR